MQDAKTIKENLDNLIKVMSENAELYCKNPGKDFTRNRKLGFDNLIHVLLGMRGNTINKELFDYFKDSELMTKSAFVQQRSKLKEDCLYKLFNNFNKLSQDEETYEGYHLYAIDGSDVNIAFNPDDKDTLIKPKTCDGYNQLHVNALYDILNKTYFDAEIQDIKQANERRAARDMIARNYFEPSILIADRGYESLNLIEDIKRKLNTEYLIRTREKGWLKEIEELPLKELDTTITFELRTSSTKEDKKLFAEGKAKWISGPSKFGKYKKDVQWDYESPYTFSCRVVRFKITDTTYETIVTSLDRFKFPISKIKELYHRRWGIETSFRELKYTIGLVNFHSKKKEFIIQEIYSRLLIYNFCQRITRQVVVVQDENRKHIYKVNFTMSAHICFDYFRHHSNNPPPDVNNLILRYIEPVREGRTDKRKLKPKSAVFFLYRVA